MGDSGHTYGIDHIPELVETAKKNVQKNHGSLLDDGKIIFQQADGQKGLEEFAPYEAIMYGGSTKKIPRKLLHQLAVGGRMVLLLHPSSHPIIAHPIRERQIQKAVPVSYRQKRRRHLPD